MADIERKEVKDRLDQNTDRALERGVFGTPTFFVGREMFWGNDRIDIVEEALRKLV
jgi:2-hydroxychromene-2-carboxylate isomerase